MRPGERVLGRVVQGDGCWLYSGTPSQRYGLVWDNDRRNNMPAHVAVWLLDRAIPDGLVLHHRCEQKRCVRPDHLVLMDGGEHSSMHNTKTVCINGHPYTDENTYYRRYRKGGGQKVCLICQARAIAKYRAANRDVLNARKRERRREEKAKRAVIQGC